MNLFSTEYRQNNKKRHEAFRSYYYINQLNTIIKISTVFFIFCLIGLFFLVPFEHKKYPDLGKLKYGIAVIGHLLVACLAKWVLESRRMSDRRKAVVSEVLSFVIGLAYLAWGIFGMEIAIAEYANPIILMYLIFLATITAFLYYPTIHYVWLVIISYSYASVVFVIHSKEAKLDMTSSICAVIMMLILGVLSNTRYRYGRDRFEYEVQNQKLIKRQEEQNEELEAQNEELIAINQELSDTTEKLSKALDDLEKASEAQKMFTNSMNHELRAPLNGIIGTLQVMMNDLTKESDIRYVEQCMTMAKSLLNIVNDLLDYAKMDAGEFEILPAPYDLHELINNIDNTFRYQAENKGIKLEFVIADDTVCGLYGDDFRIQQIISNIVSNGIKYTDEGTVSVEVSHSDETLKFVISDTGQGMSDESIKYLFVPFKRIDEFRNKKIQGTGLGMSIVLNLVKKMEGSITVDSILGEGTTFTVFLPGKVTNADNTWGHPVSNEEANTASTEDLTGRKILYVDDTGINLTIIEKLLADTGVNITTTDSPAQGLQLALDNAYDIIIVDHQMPEMSGPQLFEAIREKSDNNKSTPVIIFTGNAGAGTGEKYREMGFAGYLSKPVLKKDLIELLIKIAVKQI